MQGNNNALKNGINLVPRKLLIYQKLKIVQWIVLGLCLVALVLMTVFAVQGYMQIDDLNKELAEDKQIIAEGHLDELNALKEQYDNLILGIDSGNITLIPDIDTKMTELFSIITKHMARCALCSKMYFAIRLITATFIAPLFSAESVLLASLSVGRSSLKRSRFSRRISFLSCL